MTTAAPASNGLNWLNLSFLVATPLAAAVFVPWYAVTTGFNAFDWWMFALFMALTGFSITAGYHRLWAHRSYKAVAPIRVLYAIFGACSGQNSVMHWASDHRRHHKHCDDVELDPYCIKRGFWHAHIGWIVELHPSAEDDFSNVEDIARDPVAAWQHRNYFALTMATNFLLPCALGVIWGSSWLGTFLLAGLLRFVVNHHLTFAINSVAHTFGRRTFEAGGTARDSHLLALLTYGEGYHSFHHTFMNDYRNGWKVWHLDFSKWIIRGFAAVGLASHLQVTPPDRISAARAETNVKQAA